MKKLASVDKRLGERFDVDECNYDFLPLGVSQRKAQVFHDSWPWGGKGGINAAQVCNLVICNLYRSLTLLARLDSPGKQMMILCA